MTTSDDKSYDLEERTAKFGEAVIELCKSIPQNVITKPLISQIVRSSTSIGANYMEANGARTPKEFFHKISIVKREAKETEHWLRMIEKADSQHIKVMSALQKECHELVLIFSKIYSSQNIKESQKKEIISNLEIKN